MLQGNDLLYRFNIIRLSHILNSFSFQLQSIMFIFRQIGFGAWDIFLKGNYYFSGGTKISIEISVENKLNHPANEKMRLSKQNGVSLHFSFYLSTSRLHESLSKQNGVSLHFFLFMYIKITWSFRTSKIKNLP